MIIVNSKYKYVLVLCNVYDSSQMSVSIFLLFKNILEIEKESEVNSTMKIRAETHLHLDLVNNT